MKITPYTLLQCDLSRIANFGISEAIDFIVKLILNGELHLNCCGQ